ncbi:hypothetical protein SAMN05216388_10392 [Halorientalis persicus]|uniref:Uncharacterized protein n=1 Tax=Halorientalis persicus TaxID=1367881 RepID=A0A1H8VL30_9EURY|nr:hypothetical protein SAMN05216388_10392 [Halorientalis persicus]
MLLVERVEQFTLFIHQLTNTLADIVEIVVRWLGGILTHCW